MVDKTKVEKEIAAEITRKVLTMQSKLEDLLRNRDVTGLQEKLSNSRLPQEIKDEVKSILSASSEELGRKKIKKILQIYKKLMGEEIRGKYGLNIDIETNKVEA
jgi:flagellar basal body-associated protein FliL